MFLTSTPDATPNALLHSLKHYKVLHERNVFLTVEFRDVPWVDADDRVDCERLKATAGVSPCATDSGGTGRPARAGALRSARTAARAHGGVVLPVAGEGRAGSGRRGDGRWRDRLFAAMARNAGSVTDYFNIPTNRVVELGTRIEI